MMQAVSYQVSAGGVIVDSKGSDLQVCLIQRPRRLSRHKRNVLKSRKIKDMVWCLPKGHIEPGEDAAAAALREVHEETGLRGEIIQHVATIHYQFVEPQESQLTSKRVEFFLMHSLGGDTSQFDPEEVLQARWFAIDEALDQVTYENEKKVLELAKALLI